jgi:hypothetical protein
MTLNTCASDTSGVARSRWPRILGLMLLGVISGAISAIGVTPFIPLGDFGLLLIFFLPGLVFGLIIGPALTYGGWLTPARVAAWVVFATLGHFAAVLCVMGLTWRLEAALPIKGETAILSAATLAGTLGGGILAGGNRLLVPGAGWIAPTIVGGVLSSLVMLHDTGPFLGRFLFYGLWQARYAAALAMALPVRAAAAAPRPESRIFNLS